MFLHTTTYNSKLAQKIQNQIIATITAFCNKTEVSLFKVATSKMNFRGAGTGGAGGAKAPPIFASLVYIDVPLIAPPIFWQVKYRTIVHSNTNFSYLLAPLLPV